MMSPGLKVLFKSDELGAVFAYIPSVGNLGEYTIVCIHPKYTDREIYIEPGL